VNKHRHVVFKTQGAPELELLHHMSCWPQCQHYQPLIHVLVDACTFGSMGRNTCIMIQLTLLTRTGIEGWHFGSMERAAGLPGYCSTGPCNEQHQLIRARTQCSSRRMPDLVHPCPRPAIPRNETLQPGLVERVKRGGVYDCGTQESTTQSCVALTSIDARETVQLPHCFTLAPLPKLTQGARAH
jgi:hypothetical protein